MTPSAHDVLRADPEPFPAWLLNANEFSPEDFFSSRVVYYPGSGRDGQAFELFCATHSAHCVLHIDYNVSATDVYSSLNPDDTHHLTGYEPRVQFELAPLEAAALLALDAELCPDGQEPIVKSAIWTVLERQQNFGDEHGPKRIAFLHVQAEAVWVCCSVWRAFNHNPFAVIAQDHQCGNNWIKVLGETNHSYGDKSQLFEYHDEDHHLRNHFGGKNSLLYEFQNQPPQQLPKWLLVGEGTAPWPMYIEASDFTPPAGMGRHRRKLYRPQ